MAVISVVRMMRNWLPLTTDMAEAFAADGQVRHIEGGGVDPLPPARLPVLETGPTVEGIDGQDSEEPPPAPPDHLPQDLDEVPDEEPFDLPDTAAHIGDEAEPGDEADEELLGQSAEPAESPDPSPNYDAVRTGTLVAWAKEYLEPLGIKTRADKKTNESVPERLNRYADELGCSVDALIEAVLANEPPPEAEES
jgi:hypothetical protein